MSEWYDSQKKLSSNFHQSMQEHIEQSNPRCTLTAEESKLLYKLKAIANKLKRRENPETR